MPGLQILPKPFLDGYSGEGYIALAPTTTSVVAGTWIIAASSTAQFYCGYCTNTTHDDLDEITWSCYLASGTYSLAQLGITASDRPKIDIYIGSDKVVSAEDWYSAAPTYNVLKTTTGISVSSSNIYTIRLVCNGKNGASSNNQHYFSGIWLWRTA